MKTKYIRGWSAIDLVESRPMEFSLCKFSDPISGAESDISTDRAREIAREDPSLIYALHRRRQQIKIVMHYNGDGRSEMVFRGVRDTGGPIRLTRAQMARVRRARIGSGNDGTVGPVTFSLDGHPVDLICFDW
jgi:hypothetical protein